MRTIMGLCVLIILLGIPNAWATDYYLSDGGGGTVPTCTIGTPCDATLANVVAILADAGSACGDTLFFDRGSTSDGSTQILINHTKFQSCVLATTPLTFDAYGTGALPILQMTTGGVAFFLNLREVQGIAFKNIDIDANLRAQKVVKLRGTTDVLFEDVTMRRSTGIGVNVVGDTTITLSTNSTFNRVTIRDIGDGVRTAEGIYVGHPTNGNHQADGFTLTDSLIDNTGTDCLDIKSDTDNIIVRNNTMKNCGGVGSTDGIHLTQGIVLHGGHVNALVEENLVMIAAPPPGSRQGSAGIRLDAQSTDNVNVVVQRNIIADYDDDLAGLRVRGLSASEIAQVTLDHNTIVGNEECYLLVSGSDPTNENAICWDNLSGNDAANPQFITFSADADPTNDNWNLQAGSPAVNDATDGSDRGALFSPVIASCEAVDANTVNVNWTILAAFLPLSAVDHTALAIRQNAVGLTENAGVIQGDTVTAITVTETMTAGGGTIDVAVPTAGAVTDTARIGGDTGINSVSYVNATPVTCTNSIAGATDTMAQTDFRIYANENWYMELNGSPTSVTGPPPAEEVNDTVRAGGCVRLRIKFRCDPTSPVNCPTQAYRLQFDKNGATAWANITDTCTTGTTCLDSPHPVVASSAATTEQLTAAASFVAGEFVDIANAFPSPVLVIGAATELEWPVCVASDIAPGDFFDYRVVSDIGVVLDTYTVTPRLTGAGSRNHLRLGGLTRTGGGKIQ